MCKSPLDKYPDHQTVELVLRWMLDYMGRSTQSFYFIKIKKNQEQLYD